MAFMWPFGRIFNHRYFIFLFFLTELKSTKFKSELELKKDMKARIKEAAKSDTVFVW
jgi:hypothetical protein